MTEAQTEHTERSTGHRHSPGGSGMLKFFYGPMDCGKSLLALQLDYNRSRRGQHGLLLTKMDRSREPRISSRIGVTKAAVEVADNTNLGDLVRRSWASGTRVDYLIVDEAQFFTEQQIEQMAQLVDDTQIDVYAFGIATDFLGRMFPGSRRLFELADESTPLQVEVLCWCGRPGRFNSRIIDGQVARAGEQVVVADTVTAAGTTQVHYQVLCRQHYRTGDLGPASGDATIPLIDT